jgi:hypothetical protein
MDIGFEVRVMRILLGMAMLIGSTGLAHGQAAPAPAPAAPAPAPEQKAPAVRLGLWETTTVTTTKMPPQIASLLKQSGSSTGAGTNTAKTQSCLTADTWQKMMNVLSTPREGCSVTNNVVTPESATFHLSCSAGTAVQVEVDSKTNFESLEKVSGMMHMTTTYASLGPIAGGKVIAHSEISSKFVSEDCGTVGAGKVVTVK